jgi:tetratricopeptide (TPR) repeat protein
LVLIVLFFVALPLAAQTDASQQQEPASAAGLQEAPPAIQLLPLDTTPPDKLEDQGDNLRARSMYLDALDSYRAAIAKKPSAVLYNKLGITEIQLRRTSDALTAINRAIHMQRGYADAWNNRGSVYYLEGNYRRAGKDFEHAIKLNDQNASFHSNLGSAYFNEHHLDKASQEYQIALRLDPLVFERSSKSGIEALMGKPSDHAEFEYLMAKLYAQSGDLSDALLHLRKAIEEGYKAINNVYKDQEFATVRTDQRFKDLMAQKPEGIPQ